jgi:hypothetical protein
MSNFPVTFGDTTYSSASQLRAAFEERVRTSQLDHPGQSNPADHYYDAMSRDRAGAVEKAVREAMQDVVATSESDVEMWLAVVLCGMGNPASHYRTLLRRLRAGEVREPAVTAFHTALTQGTAIGDALLTNEIRTFLREQGLRDMLLDTLIGQAPTKTLLAETLDALKNGGLEPAKLNTIGMWLAHGGDHDSVLELGRAIAGKSRGTRTRFLSGQRKVAKTWMKLHKAKLLEALDLS